jgi:16S rRNA (guanine(966)-N(2))-methyltransferase RsmD
VRVVAGEFKGRRLATPRRGADVRPTSDRAREGLFAILGDVAADRVLDLYCGTGALAIEALSRGAAEAVLVDRTPTTAKRNVDALGLAGRATVVRDDALRYLARASLRFNLVFCDPPYKLADRLGPELERLVVPRLAEGARLICESSHRRPLDLELPLSAERRFGEALVRIYQQPAGGRRHPAGGRGKGHG